MISWGFSFFIFILVSFEIHCTIHLLHSVKFQTKLNRIYSCSCKRMCDLCAISSFTCCRWRSITEIPNHLLWQSIKFCCKSNLLSCWSLSSWMRSRCDINTYQSFLNIYRRSCNHFFQSASCFYCNFWCKDSIFSIIIIIICMSNYSVLYITSYFSISKIPCKIDDFISFYIYFGL